MFMIIFVLRSINNCFEVLMHSALILQTALGRLTIFTVLIMKIHEHICFYVFHLLISSSIYLLNGLKIFIIQAFTYFVSITPKIFYIIEILIKGSISTIFLSNHSSFLFRKATDFWSLFSIHLHCWKCLWTLGMSWWVFWGGGSLCIFLYHSQGRYLGFFLSLSFILYFFLICIHFTTLFYLIALTNNPSTILRGYEESGQLRFVLDFTWIALSFFPFKLVLAMGSL